MTTPETRISGALQENLLTLLCFDDHHAKIARAAIGTKDIFESQHFREIAGHAISFLDTYNEAIKDHLPDELEEVLQGKDALRAKLFRTLLMQMKATAPGLNAVYVMSQLNAFVRQQHLKTAVVRAVECIEDGRIDQAEVELAAGLNKQVTSFEGGLDFGNIEQALSFLDTDEGSIVYTGIKPLDDADCTPKRKELFALMAPQSRGKSWGLVHIGKWAILQRLKVLHVTLEMSEARVSQRYVQSFFGISKRKAQVRVPLFNKDRDGALQEVVYEELERSTLIDPDIRQKLARKMKARFNGAPRLKIKEFPTGALTVPMLEAYLEALERHEHFVPDVIIIDYPDLMDVPVKEARVAVGKLFKDLRGIGVKRNAAMVVAIQSNREGSTAKTVDANHAAEDFSKMMTCDTVVSFSQTDQEKALGLARLFSVKSRNDESRFNVLISQAYAIGQFALDAVPMDLDYWDQLKDMAGGHDEASNDTPRMGSSADSRWSRRPGAAVVDDDDHSKIRRKRLSRQAA